MADITDYIQSLQKQHELWKEETKTLYNGLKVKQGMRIADLGCGPGFTSLELADLAGPGGQVFAIDSSKEMLEDLGARLNGQTNIDIKHQDLNEWEPGGFTFDAILLRWVAYQLKDPARLLATARQSLKPQGRIAILDYFSQRYVFCPGHPVFERFVDAMEAYWRQQGCDVHVQQKMPGLLKEAGFRIVDIMPVVKCARPGMPLWNWPRWKKLLERFLKLGLLDKEDGDIFLYEWQSLQARDEAFFLTPPMLSIIAERT